MGTSYYITFESERPP